MNTDLQHRALVEACKRSDRNAQYQLYEKYSKAMYNICYRMVRNEMDAEDLLQNSFIDVFTKIDSYRYESTIGAWIKRIVINNCINFLKKRRLKYESWEEQMKEPVVREDNIPEHTLTVSAVKKAMRKLPDGYRTVFSLYLLEGYDHKEIGSILEISEATSKSQYSRAKKKLKEIMKTQFI